MRRRSRPGAPAAAAFAHAQIEVLEPAAARLRRPDGPRDLDSRLVRVARLEGHLARRHDGPPGTIVLGRGFSRLADLTAGLAAGKEAAGTGGALSADWDRLPDEGPRS